LDWFAGEGRILINKRHVMKQAILIDSLNSLKWTSKFMSLTVSGNSQDFPWEGFNEMGLSVNALQLLSSQAAPKTETLPTVGYVQWIQYILDTSSNLQEAIKNAQLVRVSSGTTLHYFVCDAVPNCAAFEYLKGALVIHQGNELPYKALTNNSYEDSVNYYKSVSYLPDETILYGKKSIGSLARFSRAAVWSKNFNPDTETPVAHAFRGLVNLAQFVPATPQSPGWSTYWSLAFDLKQKTLFWRTRDSQLIKSVNLLAFNPECTSGIEGLDVNVKGAGNVTSQFSPFTESDQNSAVDEWASSVPKTLSPSKFVTDALKKYRASVRCLK
jgi:choloylglycine hydrolase